MVFRRPRIRLRRSALALAAVMACAGSSLAGYFNDRHFTILTDETFPADEYILDQARFWYAIYSEVGDDEGLIHDPFYPQMVFRKVKAPGQGRAGAKQAESHVRALQDEIRAMLAKDTASWTSEDRSLRARFPAYWDSTGIMLSAERLRFQRGLKGKYRAGLERSYRYLPLIDSIFAAEGVPARLKYLPHVESSFYPFAYSKVGAAGMRQFMKSSAKRFKMKVGYQVDERRDPQASTLAAARMLAYNHTLLQSWPLAIVAYNHGPGGLAKAARTTGTKDLSTIIKSYYSNSFGFASKNFYAEFLAASSIAMRADSLFPDLRKLEPLRYRHLVLQKPLGTRFLCAATGLSPEELEEYNLGLRPATFRGNAQLPKGFTLRLPATLDLAALAGRLGGTEPIGPALAAMVAAAPKPAAEAPAAGATPVTDTLPGAQALAAAGPDKSGNAAAEAEPLAPRGKARPKLRERMRQRLAEKRPAPAEKPQAVLSEAPAPGPRDRVLPESKPVPPVAGTAPAKGKKTVASAPPVPAVPAPAGIPATVPQSAALAHGPAPAALVAAPASSPLLASAPPERLVDSTLALQASDLDKLAHPMDRFNPAIYHLDYEYANGTLVFQAGTEETLSHYSEWSLIPEKTLRRLNGIRNPKDFRMGRRIKVPLADDKAKEFMKRREEYYRAIEEDFYSNYYVSVLEPLAVSKGMNLWTWSQEREIPFWLLQKHNPGKALNELHPGDTLNLPVIETGIRKWGFTRYGNTREYLAGISRFLATGKPEAY
jgi:membrane-bound lytic murein transglycosylase D